MNKAKVNYEALLSSETLSLKQIINMARGVDADGYPYPDKECESLNQDLHYAIGHGELEGDLHPTKRHDRVRLVPLWNYLTAPERKDNPRWEPIRDVCRLWEKFSGIDSQIELAIQNDLKSLKEQAEAVMPSPEPSEPLKLKAVKWQKGSKFCCMNQTRAA